MKINLPADSPLTLISTDLGDSHVSQRGSAVVLDLDVALTLHNSSPNRVRGVTLLVAAQEVTPGGKASVSVPSLDVAPNQNFPVRINLRLLRPAQMGGGPLVAGKPGWRALSGLFVLRPEPPGFPPHA